MNFKKAFKISIVICLLLMMVLSVFGGITIPGTEKNKKTTGVSHLGVDIIDSQDIFLNLVSTGSVLLGPVLDYLVTITTIFDQRLDSVEKELGSSPTGDEPCALVAVSITNGPSLSYQSGKANCDKYPGRDLVKLPSAKISIGSYELNGKDILGGGSSSYYCCMKTAAPKIEGDNAVYINGNNYKFKVAFTNSVSVNSCTFKGRVGSPVSVSERSSTFSCLGHPVGSKCYTYYASLQVEQDGKVDITCSNDAGVSNKVSVVADRTFGAPIKAK